MCAVSAYGSAASGGTRSGSVANSSFSRLFQVSSSSFEGRAADQTGMHDAGKLHARNVARVGVDAAEVPDRLARLRIVIGEKTAAVLPGENSGEAPRRLPATTPTSRMSTTSRSPGSAPSTPIGPLRIVHLGQVDIAHVVGGLVVLDLAARPVVRISTRNSSPGLTQATIGMSGCQRL